MTETEWRSIGVQQSRGWIHYMIHKPEPHILLFRRPKTEEQAIQRNCLHAHTFTFTLTYTHTPTCSIHTHQRSDTADLRGSCYSYCATGGSCTTVGTASLKQNTRTLIHTYLRYAIRSSQHIFPCKRYYYLQCFFQYPVVQLLKVLIIINLLGNRPFFVSVCFKQWPFNFPYLHTLPASVFKIAFPFVCHDN